MQGRGLSALLLSNPCNPTGKPMQGDELARWVALARELDCSLLIDEFYSHYIWTTAPAGQLPVESAARYVEDVDRDPVVALRRPDQELALPGLARDLDGRARAGDRGGGQRRVSFLDGGGSKPLQRAAIPLLEDAHVVAETQAIHAAFRAKRDLLCSRGWRGWASRIDRAARRHVLRLGQRRRACRRRSTTAWASSAPRWSSR